MKRIGKAYLWLRLWLREACESDRVFLAILYLGVALSGARLFPEARLGVGSPLRLALAHVVLLGVLAHLRADPRDGALLRSAGFLHTLLALGHAIATAGGLIPGSGWGPEKIALVMGALGPAVTPHVLAVCFAIGSEQRSASAAEEAAHAGARARHSFERLEESACAIAEATEATKTHLETLARASRALSREIAGAGEAAKAVADLYALVEDLGKLVREVIEFSSASLFREEEAEPRPRRRRDARARRRFEPRWREAEEEEEEDPAENQ